MLKCIQFCYLWIFLNNTALGYNSVWNKHERINADINEWINKEGCRRDRIFFRFPQNRLPSSEDGASSSMFTGGCAKLSRCFQRADYGEAGGVNLQ